MILPLTAVWGGAPFIDYLEGNAQVFDGSFDYDRVINWNQTERTQPFSLNINAFFNTNSLQPILSTLNATLVSAAGIEILTISGFIRFIMQSSFSIGIEKTTNIAFSSGYNSIIITYDGSSNASGVTCYINNVLTTFGTPARDNLTGSIINAGNLAHPFGRPLDVSSLYFKGKGKIFELINRVATTQEIADATTTGSFRGAGVANANFLLSIDFDKVDGQDPTTFAGTPTYTITGFGGTTYTPYL